ncbi:baseplate J/gp47 family protein [Phormidium sp. CLA17]|uniref:baseplate J/gp47 family protein n=1 Tax=Leptolyngbya sp. Cla-17 TaxID=2803751 RepID=UPI00149123AA|nr:baseplate J/gp47 family protein [Leptolyngbya sp. Cla-17]MBM0740400.1 baseplate J/gp47 family protein [Leptolyngbya sp. Cla-17]
MPINIPPLDDRNYADILRDALARIPVHNPEWTNFNDSDPGVTIIQLFAFMTESILYRANQIPERNRLKFLQLLGIPLAPAATAQGFVTLTNERGPLASRTFDAGLDVRAGQVRFRTTQGLDVLPIAAQLFYKRPIRTTPEQDTLYRQLYADLLGEGVPAFYETATMPQPATDGSLPVLDLAEPDTTVDGCLWIALLARTANELAAVRSHLTGKTLTLGIMPRLDDDEVSVTAGQTQRTEAQAPPVRWEIVDATTSTPTYRLLESRSNGSFLNAPGMVELKLPTSVDELTGWNFAALEPGLEGTGEYPPSLADTNLGDRLITWIRLRLDKQPTNQSAKVRLSWVGINATQVQQKILVTGEVVGSGTGEPDQCFRLANTPVLPDSLVLTVGNEPWQRVNDLLAADSEVPVQAPRLPIYQSEAMAGVKASPRTKVFTLDPESGDLCFGDGAHGTRPTQRIVASYAFGGGRQGNLGLGSINRSPQLPAGYKVTNPIRTWGGDDAQDTASAERGVSRFVQHRDRLVSVQDFKDITWQTPGVDLGRVEVLPLFDPANPGSGEIPGVVTVLVVPASPTTDNPQPDQFFLESVCNHLQPRRLVTTELHVRGPQYVDVWVSVSIEILGGYATGPVREAVKQALYRFLSPLYGGQQQTGWSLGVSVLPQELEAIVARVAGVRLVNNPLLLGSATANNVATIAISGLMLPRLIGVSVTEGPPIPLEQLRNAPPALPLDGTQWTPIPVLPERC